MTKYLGRLSIVAVPIGNPQDITLRARNVLEEVDAVICEEVRPASTLLKRLNLQKELICLNEHNEPEQVPIILQRLSGNQHLALISDCGTPVFADPGRQLIEQAAEMQVQITPVPGASSLMAALSISDIRLDQFFFAGFLPRGKEERVQLLKKYRNLQLPVVLMDTPYRLAALLQEISVVFGAKHRVILAMDLTLPSESILRDTVDQVRKVVGTKKAEFVLIVQ
ncbi:MAG TPA: 16S rRNA (cytidine(1402)-2'-O)-methyltransferase [Anaerolineaceae bacterium]